MQTDFDVIIVGAGPAGCACALMLTGKGLRICVLEKFFFPREKICGDALSTDIINQMDKLPEELKQKFLSFSEKMPTHGARFYAPNNEYLEIDFPVRNGIPPGYVCQRKDFDNLLFEQIKKYSDIKIYENSEVIDVEQNSENIKVKTDKNIFTAKMLVGADGAHSVVGKKLLKDKFGLQNHCTAIRSYYENVTGFSDKNYIELYFINEVLPGYLWIFPMAGNKANVGVGLLSDIISEKKINLKKFAEKVIAEHPLIAPRFKNAVQIDNYKAWKIPVGLKKCTISGDRFLLIGDAASLVDPFTGEGVGNALRSGRVAAEHILKCMEKNTYNATFNKKYDEEIYCRVWKELKLNHSIQKLFKHGRLINYAVQKANKNKHLKALITEAISNNGTKAKLLHLTRLVNPFVK